MEMNEKAETPNFQTLGAITAVRGKGFAFCLPEKPTQDLSCRFSRTSRNRNIGDPSLCVPVAYKAF